MVDETKLLTIANYAKLQKVDPVRIYQLISEKKIIPFIINEVNFINSKEYPKLPVRPYMKYKARKISIK